ncbi:MAG: YdbH domain-containing protein [Anaerolineae bacterium]|nr:YdbH domain-containing protein [Phycisphaerae bacterium]
MKNRIWKWIFGVFAIGAVIAGIGAVVLYFSLPVIVRNQVRDVLAKAGYKDATFNVDSASLYAVRVSNLKAGPNGELNVSSAQLDYAPLKAINGRIESLRVERANFVIDLNAGTVTRADSPTSQPTDFFASVDTKGLPLWRIELADCSVTLVRGDHKYVVRADGWVWRERADRARLSLQFRIANAPAWMDGSVDFTERRVDLSAGASDIDLAALMPFVPDIATNHVTQASGLMKIVASVTYVGDRLHPTLSIGLRDANVVTSPDYGVTLNGVRANIALQNLNPLRAEPGQMIQVDHLRVSEDIEIQNVNIAFGVDRHGAGQHSTSAPVSLPASILLSTLSFNWAGGSIASAGPVVINPKETSGAIDLQIRHVGLNEFIKLVSSGRASGTGSLSGDLPIALEWPRLTIGTGQIKSDGPGDINFGQQVTDIAKTVAARDQRFKGQQQQLIAALTHFHYDQIVFDFDRTDEGLQVTSRITGRGTEGVKAPIDLTIRYNGLEEALNAYLSTTLRVRSSGD